MEALYRSIEVRPDNIEYEIKELEQAMGITTPAERLLETRLFIDEKFIITSLLTNSTLPIERMFGDEEWAGYLRARLETKQYSALSERPSIEPIDILHSCLIGEAANTIDSIYHDGDGGLGGQFINGEFFPIDLTEAQVEGLKSQEFVDFLSADDPENPRRGFIKYPHLSLDEVQTIFFIILAEAQRSAGDPYLHAARLQQTFIQLHPFVGGMCGRMSRILMNWYLESRSCPPSILEDFDQDLFTPLHEWADKIRSGSQQYLREKERIQKGASDPLEVLDIKNIKRLHDQDYTPSPGITVPSYLPGEIHPHKITDDYLADFESYVDWFLGRRPKFS